MRTGYSWFPPITMPWIVMRLFIFAVVCLLSDTLLARPAADPLDSLKLLGSDGRAVELHSDDPVGLMTRPLREFKQRLDQLHYPDFLQFRKISVKYGSDIRGSLQISQGPLRITVYNLFRELPDGEFSIRVVSTGYFLPNELAELQTIVHDYKNNVFIMTAEKVRDAHDLNSHLAYMASQDNTILLKGYGTSWNLSKLKLKMRGKTTSAADEDAFVREADWLVSRLINPQWILFIRTDRNK